MTPRGLRYVRLLMACRDRPPTLSQFIRKSWRVYLILAVAFGVVTLVFAASYGELGVWPFVASFVTLLLRDLGHARRSIASWPTMRDVLDWPKIEQLASSDGAPLAT